GGAGGLQRVLDAVLLLLHLGLGRRADLDDRDAARQLREALLELLAIEVGVGVLEHPLAAVTEARRLDGDGGERAAELVDDDRRERLALDVLGHDHEWTTRL